MGNFSPTTFGRIQFLGTPWNRNLPNLGVEIIFAFCYYNVTEMLQYNFPRNFGTYNR